MSNHKVLELAALDRIAGQIRSTTDPALLRERLNLLLEYYGLINFEMKYSRCYWRARICNLNQPFHHVSEMGHPPAEVTSAGRLNSAGKPILYLTPNQLSALAEVGAEEGSCVQLLAYDFRQDKKLCCGVLGEIERVSRWGTAFCEGGLGGKLNRILNSMDYEVGSSFVYPDTFLASLMRDKLAGGNEYLHSRTLAELLFEKNKQVQALLYSGIAVDGAMNVAVLPSAAEEVLEPKASCLVRVKQTFRFGFCRFEVLRYAPSISSDGQFEWNEN